MTSTPEPCTCIEVFQLVTDYIEGGLQEVDSIRIDSHLHDCDGCDGYVEQVRTTIRITSGLGSAGLSPEARERLLLTFRSWANPSERDPA